jgi:hypothetical protein
MSSLESFVLGVLITVVVSVLAPFSTGPISRGWATRSKKRGTKLVKALEAECTMIEALHENQFRLLTFIGTRVLVLTIWWIGQSLLDVLFGFVINGFDAFHSALSYAIFPINTDAVSNWLSAAASLVDAVILAILFRTGIRSYRTVKHVINFDEYMTKIRGQITTLKEKNKFLDDPSGDGVDGGTLEPT